jgi:hypothetical protein
VILTKIQKSLMLFNSNLLVAKYNQKIWAWMLWILMHYVVAKC